MIDGTWRNGGAEDGFRLRQRHGRTALTKKEDRQTDKAVFSFYFVAIGSGTNKALEI